MLGVMTDVAGWLERNIEALFEWGLREPDCQDEAWV